MAQTTPQTPMAPRGAEAIAWVGGSLGGADGTEGIPWQRGGTGGSRGDRASQLVTSRCMRLSP